MIKTQFFSFLLFPLIVTFNFFFSLVFWPLFLILTLVSEFVRKCTSLLLYACYGSTYTLMDSCDAAYSYTLGPNDPGSPIFSICIITGEPDIEDWRRRFSKAFKHPAYKKLKLSIDTKFGYPVWKETENFDIRKLIRYWEDPDDNIDEQRLYKILGDYSITPLPVDHPEWEMLIIPQGIKMKEDEGKGKKTYAITLRMNHCYSDALSFMMMMSSTIQDTPYELSFDPTKELTVSIWQWAYIYSTMALFGPWRVMSNFIMLLIGEKGKTKFSRTSFSSESRTLVNQTPTIDFEILKEIKKKAKVSITAIIYASISVALRKCHLRLHPNEKVPLRVGNSSQVIANLPYPKDKFSNQFAVNFIPIPLAAKEDSKSENSELSEEHYKNLLRNCHYSGIKMMKYGGPILQKRMQYFICSLPKAFGQAVLRNGGSDICLSNIPGPINEGTINGGTIVGFFFLMPLMNIGIGIVSSSHKKKFKMYFSADQRVIRDYENLEILSSDIMEAIELYKKIYTD